MTRRRIGWSRPIYAFRRGLDVFLGFLEREGNQFALLSGTYGDAVKTSFRADDLSSLSRIAGVAVPV